MKQFLESTNLLQTVIAETEKTSEEAGKLAHDLTEEQLNWKPAPDRWSIAQCLDHLALTTEKFDPYFTVAIARAREQWPASSAPKYRPTRMGGWLIRQLVPEAAKKVPSPKVFRPAETVAIDGALNHFLKAQTNFLGFVRLAEGVDYNKTRLRSPVTFLMRYSLADAFVITAVHGQRHLGQARRVRGTEGFPG
jgi:hypothetical protein